MTLNSIAVVVTFNKKEMLKECINALLGQTVELNGIVIFDNGSTDGTREYLSKVKNKRIHCYFSDKNLGGAGGFNQAIKKAMQFAPTAVWIMDDDSIVEREALSELINAKNELGDNFGFLASNVLWTDGTPCLMNIPGVDKVWNQQMKSGLVKLNRASFVSLYVNADAIKKVGYPISDFFIWGDDIEYSQRISKEFPCYFVSKSVVIHKMKENAEVDILVDDSSRIPRYYYDIRNKFYRFKKKGTKELIKYIVKVLFLIIKIIFTSGSHKIKKISVVLKGFFSGIFFNPKVEKYDEVNS